MSRYDSRARRSAKTGAIELIVRPTHSTPVRVAGWCWRTRYELLALVAVVVSYSWLDDRLPTWAVYVVLLGVPAVLVAVPYTRGVLVGRVMCVVTRHRLRSCLAQRRVMNHDGHLPWFLWTRPTPVGERLWLWMRPGVAACDLEHAIDYLAAACFARDARVARSRRVSALVIVDVVRHDPLVSGAAIDSPLIGRTTPDADSPAAARPLPRRHLHPVPSTPRTAPTVEPAPPAVPVPAPPVIPEQATPTQRTTKPKTSSSTTPAPPVVLVGGEDVTDYV